MNVITPQIYATGLWWQVLAKGVAGQTQRSWASLEKLEAIIAGRRAACTAKVKAMRSHSERGIARLIRETVQP
jgi:hypothetical protein